MKIFKVMQRFIAVLIVLLTIFSINISASDVVYDEIVYVKDDNGIVLQEKYYNNQVIVKDIVYKDYSINSILSINYYLNGIKNKTDLYQYNFEQEKNILFNTSFYDEQGKMIEQRSYNETTTRLTTTYLYNINGNVKKVITYLETAQGDDLINDIIEYTYDQNNNYTGLIKVYLYNYDGQNNLLNIDEFEFNE